APLLIVPDVLEALRELGRAARARSHAKVVAVTGSVGKNSTQEALPLAFSTEGATYAAGGCHHKHWGASSSAARCPANATHAVFEVGMNQGGEIKPLTNRVRPHVAVITGVEPVHLEYFGSLEKTADAKAEIFAGVEPGGTAVLNRDNPLFARLAAAARSAKIEHVVSFGEESSADARLLRLSLQPDSSTIEASILGQAGTSNPGGPGGQLPLNS